MRIMTLLALATVCAAPMAAQRDSLSRADRERLQTRLEQLQQEMRELQRQLGTTNTLFLRSEDNQPFAWSVVTDNRARLGVVVATGSTDSDGRGARLQAVTPNGPAADAGLRAGDIVTKVNGVTLVNARPSPGERLIAEVEDLEDGDSVRVEYRRDDRAHQATIVARASGGHSFGLRTPLVVQLDSMRDQVRRFSELDQSRDALTRALVEVREMPGLHSNFFTSRWSSMELTTLNADLGGYFGTTDGILVVRAPSDSLLGLKSGDVVLRIGGRVPTSPSHAIRILQSYNAGDQIRIDIMRQRRQQTLNATVPEDRDRGLYWEWK